MTLVATLTAVAIAAILFVAALEKLRDPAPAAETIAALGVPHARLLAMLLGVVELLAGIAALFVPDARVTQFVIVALGVTFAAAGVVALLRGQAIRCRCFGSGGGRLGVRQLLALPLWLAGAGMLRQFATRPSLEVAAACFAFTSLAIASYRAIEVRKRWSEARGDRRSAEEMYLWLPSH